MVDNVTHLRLAAVGDGTEIACDQVLTQATGQFEEVVVLGVNRDGVVEVRGSRGVERTFWLIEAAKHTLIDMSMFNGS